MKIFSVFACYALLLYLLLFQSACYWAGKHPVENRTRLCKTNVIGIIGDASTEPYIEIRYSVADESTGYNKTESIMVSPPYLFKNDKVYMTYEYGVWEDNLSGIYAYYEKLLHDYEEGGAEYLRIINHSADKEMEFFVAGAEDDFTIIPSGERDELGAFPSVRYKKAPVYYLLYPEHKYPYNKDGYYGEGDRCGDLILTEAWTVDEVAELYRAEYNRSDTVKLFIWTFKDTENRMLDYISGLAPYSEEFRGIIFYGVIKPGEQLTGSNKLWLLATRRGMFSDFLVREGKL